MIRCSILDERTKAQCLYEQHHKSPLHMYSQSKIYKVPRCTVFDDYGSFCLRKFWHDGAHSFPFWSVGDDEQMGDAATWGEKVDAAAGWFGRVVLRNVWRVIGLFFLMFWIGPVVGFYALTRSWFIGTVANILWILLIFALFPYINSNFGSPAIGLYSIFTLVSLIGASICMYTDFD